MSIHGPTIIITDLDDTVTVTLTNANAPNPIPQIQQDFQVETGQNQEGENGAGLRTFQVAGTRDSFGEIEIAVKYLTPAQHADLKTLYQSQPVLRLKFTLDGGTTWWRSIWQPGKSYDPRNWKAPQWARQSASIKLLVTGVYTPP